MPLESRQEMGGWVWCEMTISAIENVAADFMRPGHLVIWDQGSRGLAPPSLPLATTDCPLCPLLNVQHNWKYFVISTDDDEEVDKKLMTAAFYDCFLKSNFNVISNVFLFGSRDISINCWRKSFSVYCWLSIFQEFEPFEQHSEFISPHGPD